MYNETILPAKDGIVMDIKRFAVHDGDGIRTTVFLKGCPLRCRWCHNPEGLSVNPVLAFYNEKCVLCGECVKTCPTGAHSIDTTTGKHTIDREKCVTCGKCADACLSDALKLCGKKMSVDEVLKIVLEDKIFYETSGGGMTLSGGEPTMQPSFALALLQAAKKENLATALDTCGFAKRETYEALMPFVDKFLFDVKHITREGHIRCTGVPNDLIIDNLRFLSDSGAAIEIRIPFVPGYNDDDATIDGIGKLLEPLNITRVKLLPYHGYARSKYDSLGMTYEMPEMDRPSTSVIEHAASLLRSHNLDVICG